MYTFLQSPYKTKIVLNLKAAVHQKALLIIIVTKVSNHQKWESSSAAVCMYVLCTCVCVVRVHVCVVHVCVCVRACVLCVCVGMCVCVCACVLCVCVHVCACARVIKITFYY